MVRTERISVFVEGLNVPGYGRSRINFSYYPSPPQNMSFFNRYLLSKWITQGAASASSKFSQLSLVVGNFYLQ
jgi:hypothetical protein